MLSRIVKTKLIFLIILVVLVISIIIVFNSLITFQKEDFEQKRVRVLNELSLQLKKQELKENTNVVSNHHVQCVTLGIGYGRTEVAIAMI
jgi:signal transduction histidine kinase